MQTQTRLQGGDARSSRRSGRARRAALEQAARAASDALERREVPRVVRWKQSANPLEILVPNLYFL